MPEAAPGDRIAKDIVLSRPLIQGGMGTVWVARHEGLKSDVAVKLLSANLADDDVAKQRFAREAASAMEIQSPHVVQMLDYGVTEAGAPYIVMELLSGQDLEAQLASGPLPAGDVVSIITQVGRALHGAHERNILHRDVKPANVFLIASDGFSTDKYLVKLLDFGFAKRVDRLTAQLTREGMIVGTPQYMSPEQMTGTKLDSRSDLFSLGSVAFEAFTGRRAFPGETLREVDDAIQRRPIPRPTLFNSKLPKALDAWFAKACARDRDERFASARELVAALKEVFAQDGPASINEAAPEGRRMAASSSSSASRTIAWLIIVVAVAATVFFIMRK